MVEHSDYVDFSDISVPDELQYIHECVKAHRDNPTEFPIKTLFLHLILGPDPASELIGDTAGHVIYRLSDHIDPEVRQQTPVYPDSSENVLPKIIDEHGIPWASLQQWREWWLRVHPVIPQFSNQPKALSPHRPES